MHKIRLSDFARAERRSMSYLSHFVKEALGHRVPLDCALLAFAVCCITVAELQKRCSGQCETLHDQHKKTAAR